MTPKLLFLSLFLFSCLLASGQEYDRISKPDIRPGMSYHELERLYDVKDYNSFGGMERHSPRMQGLYSAIIPGLGQMVDGQVGRGILHFSASAVLFYLCGSSFYYLADRTVTSKDRNQFCWRFFSGLAGSLAVHTFSCLDAVKMTKVKNMYWSDLRGQDVSFTAAPFVDRLDIAEKETPVAGISLKIAF